MITMIHYRAVKYGIALATLAASAGTTFGQLTPARPVMEMDDVWITACIIADWVYTFALVLGVVMAIVAAYKYMFSGGSEQQVTEAHKAITYAAVGIAVALVAYGVPSVVSTLIGGGAVAGC